MLVHIKCWQVTVPHVDAEFTPAVWAQYCGPVAGTARCLTCALSDFWKHIPQTGNTFFFFRKLIHETCQILATFDGKQSLLNQSKTSEIFYLTRMAFGSQKHIPERLKLLKWPLQCRQDSIISNLYVVHSFNHVIVILGCNAREVVHTIHKEDSWNCFLSFVFEAP